MKLFRAFSLTLSASAAWAEMLRASRNRRSRRLEDLEGGLEDLEGGEIDYYGGRNDNAGADIGLDPT